MKYVDQNGNEIEPTTIDENAGQFVYDPVVIKHEAIPHKEAIIHYAVEEVIFTDGTRYEPTGEDDPHIKAIDAEAGVFEYMDQGEGKEYFGMGLCEVIDEPEVEAVDEWEEIEEIMRYIPYTEEELAEITEQKRQAEEAAAKVAEREAFLDVAPKYFEALTSAFDTEKEGV